MLVPHAGPEAFVGGPGGAAMLPHLKDKGRHHFMDKVLLFNTA